MFRDGQNSLSKSRFFVKSIIPQAKETCQTVERKGMSDLEKENGKNRIILYMAEDENSGCGQIILCFLLEINGFQILSMDAEVTPEKIVKTAERENIELIVLTGNPALTKVFIQKTIALFCVSGFREEVKILVGGQAVTHEEAKMLGADDWADSSNEMVTICLKWATKLKYVNV